MVSTDSGYDIGADQALQAIYELLDLLTPETACKVAYQNIERILESQPPTETQIRQIEELSRQAGEMGTRKLNKRMANELVFELQKKAAASPPAPTPARFGLSPGFDFSSIIILSHEVSQES